MFKRVTLAEVEARIGVVSAAKAEIYGDITIGDKEFSWDAEYISVVQKQLRPYVNKPLKIGLKNGKYGWEYSDAGRDGDIQVNFPAPARQAGRGKNFSGPQGLPRFIKWLMDQHPAD